VRWENIYGISTLVDEVVLPTMVGAVITKDGASSIEGHLKDFDVGMYCG